MMLSAYVKNKETREITLIESDYKSKKAFAFDLRCNGYMVVRISNKRDLRAQDFSFESFYEMKKIYKVLFQNDETKQLELKEIEALPL